MSWVPAEKVLATVAELRKLIDGQHRRIKAATQQHRSERLGVELRRDQAAHDLGQALLPVLDNASLARAEQTTGLSGLVAEDIAGQREARRAWLPVRIAEIEREPRHANRVALRHPVTGSLVQAMARARSRQQPAAELIETCQGHPRFGRLWATRFGADDSTPWWRISYWKDRAAAKEILALFPGQERFADLLDQYDKAAELVAATTTEMEALGTEIALGETLENEHRTLTEELANLDERWLSYTRQRLVNHLLGLDAGRVAQHLARWSAHRGHFLRTSALTAKLTYLDALHKKHLADLTRELDALTTRLDGVEARTRRRWAAMPADKYANLAKDRGTSYAKRWQRYERIYGLVLSFQRFDRGRRYAELLWWDLFTRGRYDGSFIQEVWVFHKNHPTYSFDVDLLRAAAEVVADEAEAAAAAIEVEVDAGAEHELGADAS